MRGGRLFFSWVEVEGFVVIPIPLYVCTLFFSLEFCWCWIFGC